MEKEPGDYICTKVGGVDMLALIAETCSSSRYMQLAPPVGLSSGFGKGCSFYLEYVEKEPYQKWSVKETIATETAT